MKVFPSRSTPEYLDILRAKLSMDIARNEAVPIMSAPRVTGDQEYDRCIRIDYIGVAATTLFDRGGAVTRDPLYTELRALTQSVEELNRQGIFLKLRFLFEYPYSVSAYTRIQAEHATRRAAINNTLFLRDLRLTKQVDEKIFAGSDYVSRQRNALRSMQELFTDLDETGLWNDLNEPKQRLNSFVIRFTPVQPGMCCLFINNTAFFDVYLLAKENKHDVRCKPFGPVVQVERTDGVQFAAFQDHFRYLWDLDITMDCEDATSFSRGLEDVEDKLADIKPPHVINFDHKGRRLKAQIEREREKSAKGDEPKSVSSAEIGTWKAGINRRMNRLCADLSPAPTSEVVFIACSWQLFAGKYNPNIQASELYEFLHTNFAEHGFTPISKINIMQATVSSSLDTVLYTTLQDSTIGIVLLTGDIIGTPGDQETGPEPQQGNRYSKPNVYHELGFMMSQLPDERIVILAEKGVNIPTNIQDVTRLDFEKGKLCLIYSEIASHLGRIAAIDEAGLLHVLENLRVVLDKELERGNITSNDKANAVTDINGRIAKLSNQSQSR